MPEFADTRAGTPTELSVPAELLRKKRLGILEEGHLGDIEVSSQWGSHISRGASVQLPRPPLLSRPSRGGKLQASPLWLIGQWKRAFKVAGRGQPGVPALALPRPSAAHARPRRAPRAGAARARARARAKQPRPRPARCRLRAAAAGLQAPVGGNA